MLTAVGIIGALIGELLESMWVVLVSSAPVGGGLSLEEMVTIVEGVVLKVLGGWVIGGGVVFGLVGEVVGVVVGQFDVEEGLSSKLRMHGFNISISNGKSE